MKNMNDIRAMLCDVIQEVRDKKTTATDANAITNATGKILSTIKLELEYAKLTNKKPDVDFISIEDVKVASAETAK